MQVHQQEVEVSLRPKAHHQEVDSSSRTVPERAAFAALAWAPGAGVGPDRYSIEVNGTTLWRTARMWSNTGTLVSSTQGAINRLLRVVIGVDGVGTFYTDSTNFVRLPPGNILIYEGHQTLRTVNEGLWARCEWQLTTPSLRQDLVLAQLGQPIKLSQPYFTLLTSMTNVISTASDAFGGEGSQILRDALANAVLAAVLDAIGRPESLSPSQAKVLAHAHELIEHRYTDPDFGLPELAAELNLSVRQLTRTFAASGSTARVAIENRRLAAADSLFAVNKGWNRASKDAAARAAGFSSMRQLELARRRRQRE